MVEEYRLPTLFAAGAMLLLATVVLAKRPHGRLQQAFFLFMAIRSSQWFLLFIDGNMYSLTARLSEYATVALPFAAAYFAFHFMRERSSWRQRLWPGIPWLLLLGAGASIFAQVWWRDLWLEARPNLSGAMLVLGYLSFALVGAMMIWSATKTRGEMRRRSLHLLGVAFLLEPAFRCMQFGVAALWFDNYEGAMSRVFAGAYLVSLAVAIEAGLHSARVQRANWPWIAVLTATVAGLLVESMFLLEMPIDLTVWTMFTVAAVFNLAIFAAAAYALLHGQVFNIDLGVKATIRQSTVAVIVTLTFLVISESVEAFTPVDGLWPSVMAAVAIALGLKPIQWGATRLADRVLPGVEKSPEYETLRRMQLYQAVLEETYEDGVLTPKERRVLDGLQKNLGVPDDKARQMEAAMEARFREPEGI